jgi:acetoin utilization deacetylase AcuC-like enzyme
MGNYNGCLILLSRMDDDTFSNLFEHIVVELVKQYDPEAIVMCCGADGLVNDRLGPFNLTSVSYGKALSLVKAFDVPLLLVGGGGYNNANVARCWTHMTATALGVDLSDDIPEHDEFLEYGPSYKLSIPQGTALLPLTI